MGTQTFAIVGLGLLGGSLGQALQIAFPKAKVLGYSRSASKIKLAKKKGFIHAGSADLEDVISRATIVIVCTPVDSIPKLIRLIDSAAALGTIVTDVGSTKATLVAWARRQSFKNITFIGSHPMAGSHLTGLEHSRRDLYKNATVFVTPSPGIKVKALNSVVAMWKRLQCRVIKIDAARHDQIVSEISQFPHLVAALLVQMASNQSLPFASTGFRDTTRIAQGDPDLWLPIFMTNRQFMERLIKCAGRELERLERALRQKDSKFLLKFLKNAAKKRQKIV